MYIFIDKSISNILERVLNLTTNERKRRIEYSQNFIKRYSWKNMAEETLKIYESFMNQLAL